MDLPLVAIEIGVPPPALLKSPPVRLLKRSNPYFRADEFRKEGSAAGGRQEWFYEKLRLISKTLASRHVPFAFIDKVGNGTYLTAAQ